jgi:hypothetical protein
MAEGARGPKREARATRAEKAARAEEAILMDVT